MSAPRADVPETVAEKKGLSKYVTRMKTVLRRKDGSKRFSISSRSPIVIPSTGEPRYDSEN
jgi:hypothetical protein